MVSTRSSRGRKPPPKEPKVLSPNDNDDDDSVLSAKEAEAVVSPTPVSSSDENESFSSSSVTSFSAPRRKTATANSSVTGGGSRLYAPYRTMGIISSGQPYCLTHTGASSLTSFCTLPIGNRFHVLQCDGLHPTLASQACGSDDITRIESDPSLEITVAVHGRVHVTLYSRTRPVTTLKVSNQSKTHAIVDMVDLGRIQMKRSDTDRKENTKVLALIVSKQLKHKQLASKHASDSVPVLGDSSSDEDDREEHSSSSDSGDGDEEVCGQVVLILAGRTSLQIMNRTALSVDFGAPTVGIHPSTYVNKILVGSNLGKLLLLNVRSCKMIHEFSCIRNHSAAVTTLEQSPAMDTVAVGTAAGMVHLVNIKHDALLFSLHHMSKITSLSFRTDGSALRYGIAPLAVGRSDGTISIWDLTPKEQNEDDDLDDGEERTETDTRTLLCELTCVHPGGVSRLDYLPQEPLLISNGAKSNSVMQHVFDNPNHTGRLLRQRAGHTEPPSCVRYVYKSTELLHQSMMDGTDASVCQVLSGGGNDCTLRSFSSVRSVLDRELSQGQGLAKKAKRFGVATSDLLLPPIVDVSTCNAKSRDWGDAVTIHQHHALAYVWNTRRGAQSGPVLRQPEWNISAMQVQPPPSTHATAVCLSACGNYCLVGTKSGKIFKYNVQSGIPRGSFPPKGQNTSDTERKRAHAGDINRTMRALEKSNKVWKTTKDKAQDRKNAHLLQQQNRLLVASHDMDVTGLAVDSLNNTVVSVGMDSKLTLWNFKTHSPHKKSPFMLPCPATKLRHVRDSDLAAIALLDYSVLLFDCVALAIVRRFGGNDDGRHTGPISGLDFTPDGRTLLTSSLDGTVRVWDVPTNTCVDWLAFESPPTSLATSPTGEMFATTHANQLGISLWSDVSFYQTIHVNGSQTPTEPARMEQPVPFAENLDEPVTKAARFTPEESKHERRQDPSADNRNEEQRCPPTPKEKGLITLSGLPPSHWKNLFHLELVKERNKPKEAPKKPPSAPFFLQFRGVQDMGGGAGKNSEPQDGIINGGKQEGDEWEAAWSDDDGNVGNESESAPVAPLQKRTRAKGKADDDWLTLTPNKKKMKVTHSRSHLASLLQGCYSRRLSRNDDEPDGFQSVTDYVAGLGPSAIDIALSTLCNGMHDLDEGLPLLCLASMWLLEACQSRDHYETTNAYLHRFLYLHSNIIAGIDDSAREDKIDKELGESETRTEGEEEGHQRQLRLRLLGTIGELRAAQRLASDALGSKMQHSLCLLRHFSRMV